TRDASSAALGADAQALVTMAWRAAMRSGSVAPRRGVALASTGPTTRKPKPRCCITEIAVPSVSMPAASPTGPGHRSRNARAEGLAELGAGAVRDGERETP